MLCANVCAPGTRIRARVRVQNCCMLCVPQSAPRLSVPRVYWMKWKYAARPYTVASPLSTWIIGVSTRAHTHASSWKGSVCMRPRVQDHAYRNIRSIRRSSSSWVQSRWHAQKSYMCHTQTCARARKTGRLCSVSVITNFYDHIYHRQMINMPHQRWVFRVCFKRTGTQMCPPTTCGLGNINSSTPSQHIIWMMMCQS